MRICRTKLNAERANLLPMVCPDRYHPALQNGTYCAGKQSVLRQLQQQLALSKPPNDHACTFMCKPLSLSNRLYRLFDLNRLLERSCSLAGPWSCFLLVLIF